MMNKKQPKSGKNLKDRRNSVYEHWFKLWQFRHRQALSSSITKAKLNPFATLLTVGVIGICLAMPLLLLIGLKNLQAVSSGWAKNTQITLFMKTDQSAQSINNLRNQLQEDSDIADVTYISPQAGLAQFEQASGITGLAEALPDNPLPAVLKVQPIAALSTPDAINRLVNELQQIPQVQLVQLDMAWVKRLFAIITLARHTIDGLALLLCLGVILIIGNTIRLIIENSQEEMKVLKFIGATNSFIRRPFLYIGGLYGLLGGIVAWFFTEGLLSSLTNPVERLAQAYQTKIELHGLTVVSSLYLLMIATFLGLMGAWLVSARYLRLLKH